MRVAILVLNGAFDSGLSVLLDILETANELAVQLQKNLLYELSILGLRRSVRTHHGLAVPHELVDSARKEPDVVIVPSLGAKTLVGVNTSMATSEVTDAGALLRSWSEAGVRIAGACTAAFVIASAGILDGKRATTTWWLSPAFRQRYPRVTLDESRMIVESSGVVTAGAALAHVDLALWLIRQSSPSLARATARYLVSDERPSQAVYAIPDHLVHTDPMVDRFELWAREHLTDFSLAAAARAVGASERTLQRRIRSALRQSPHSYVQQLRVEMAVHRLLTTKESFDEVALAVGYQDCATLRTLIRKKTGRSIRELRNGIGA